MKILITGGAGYIGSVLTNELLSKGYHVTVYDNLMYKQTSLLNCCSDENFKFVHGDVRDIKRLKQYLNVDVIIPLAAVVGFPACAKDEDTAIEINVGQIGSILNHTKHQKIIFPNTNSGYGIGDNELCTEESPLNPVSCYGKTKVQAEKYLLDSGRAVCLRLATVFGVSPRMRLDLLVNDFTYRAYVDGAIVLFESNFRRNYIHILDVVDTFLFMIDNYEDCVGETFNVGLSDANLTKLELANKIKEHIPDFSIQLDEYKSDPDKRDYIVSNEKIENKGWYPLCSLDDGIKELIQAYKMIVPGNRKFTNL